MHFKLILSLVLLSLFVVFIVQNAEVVDMRFLFWKLSMSRSLMFFFVLLTGIIVGWALHSYTVHRKRASDGK